MDRADNLIGRQINQYILVRRLGAGTYGAVYLGEHIINKSQVAIKILFDRLSTETIPEFVDEAKFSLFQHPHVVRIRDFGIENSYPYFVMNYLPQGNLRMRHPWGSILPWETVVSYAQQIAQALYYIHDKDIVHRDIKPENLLIGEDGTIQLSDFGISVTSYTVNQRLQEPKGSLYYTAPEQIEGHACRASDQYSLGIMIYEWLTGAPPFEGTRDEVILQQLHAYPVPLRNKNAQLSPQVEKVIMKMLNKRPEDRFKNIKEFLLELERIKDADILDTFTIFTIHTEAVQSLSWSPDGKYIASAGQDRTVQVWEAATGRVFSVYREHRREIWIVAWSPNGKYIASAGSDELVKIWDATTNLDISIHAEHVKTVRALSWSPQSTALASAGDDGEVRIWDIQKGCVLVTYSEHEGSVLSLSWSPDNRYIASGGNDYTARIWHAQSGRYQALFRGHTDRITSVAWSPNSDYLASASDDGTIRIWQLTTGTTVRLFENHLQTISSLVWSPDGNYLISGSWDKTVRLWDIARNICLNTYQGHTEWVNAVAWSPSGLHIASASWDKTVHVRPLHIVMSLPNAKTLSDLT
jgi:eukaryotic-like serine/threonine-protein kinase